MSATSTSPKEWIKLDCFSFFPAHPAGFTTFLGPFSMNPDEFFVISDSFTDGIEDEICKYNTKKNEWMTIFDINKDLKCPDAEATFDKKNQLIYISGNDSNLFQIDLKEKIIKTISTEVATEAFPKMAIHFDKIHIVTDSSKHLIFDECNKTLTEIHDFGSFEGSLYTESIFYMKSRNSILLFGNDESDGSNRIHEFSLSNNEWNEWNVQVPSPLVYSAIFTSKHERYIFILGGIQIGEAEENEESDKISVYDVTNGIFRECSMKCPKEGRLRGLTVNNEHDDELLVFGYINKLYRSSEFNGIQIMPHYLIQLIRSWVCNEFVHLIEHLGDGKHWKINIDHIICSFI